VTNDDHWDTYLRWLGTAVPAAAATLNPPADDVAIAALTRVTGQPLPEAVLAGWRRHDGEPGDTGVGVLLGFDWLSTTAVRRHWTEWAQLRADNSAQDMAELSTFATSDPAGAIRTEYTHPGWIPLYAWPYEANYVGLDYAPGPAGRAGQVINFGRDFDDKKVLAPDFDTFLGWLAAQAATGRLRPQAKRLDWHPDGHLVSALTAARLCG
jgi:cell wall assembly regulator SMI1